MNSLRMKAELAGYFRFIRQMPVVAVEAFSEDIIIVTPSRRMTICEIKVSASDMRIDLKKRKHAAIRNELALPLFPNQADHCTAKNVLYPNAFYFAVPTDLEEKALKIRDELYPYAGLIVVRPSRAQFLGHSVYVARPAVELHKEKVKTRLLSKLVKAQSASLANAYARLVRYST